MCIAYSITTLTMLAVWVLRVDNTWHCDSIMVIYDLPWHIPCELLTYLLGSSENDTDQVAMTPGSSIFEQVFSVAQSPATFLTSLLLMVHIFIAVCLPRWLVFMGCVFIGEYLLLTCNYIVFIHLIPNQQCVTWSDLMLIMWYIGWWWSKVSLISWPVLAYVWK